MIWGLKTGGRGQADSVLERKDYQTLAGGRTLGPLMDKGSKRGEHVISGLQRWNQLVHFKGSTNSAQVLQRENGIFRQFSASGHGSASGADLHSAPVSSSNTAGLSSFHLGFLCVVSFSTLFLFHRIFHSNILSFSTNLINVWNFFFLLQNLVKEEQNRWRIFEVKLLKRINNESHVSWTQKQMFTNAPYMS